MADITVCNSLSSTLKKKTNNQNKQNTNKMNIKKTITIALMALTMTACKKEEVGPTNNVPSQCQQAYNNVINAYNEDLSVVNQLWQSGQIVDCEGYIGAANYYRDIANAEAAAYQDCTGYVPIAPVTDCPPR